MGKLLSWVVLLMLAWLVLRLLAISQRRRERGGRHPEAATHGRASTKAAPAAEHGEKILPCAHCGLFVPASDAVRDGDTVYCSVAHRAAARAGRSPASDTAGRPGHSGP